MSQSGETTNAVLHVVVVGFHHKKGCQVEYSYPPLIAGNEVHSSEVPDKWKYLPSLALPDGSHNFSSDTVFFHLPPLSDASNHTIYGISCYRQIDSKHLVNRDADVTRNSVQKSVCVLSRLPLYGLIEAKLALITHAYFDECDFRQVSLLEATYNNLNASLNDELVHDSQVFLGLSCRELVSTFRHKVVVLFKLLLLERRVLFFSSPVKQISTSVLALVSLFPGMIESGLHNCVQDSTWRPLSASMKHLSGTSETGSYVQVDLLEDGQSASLTRDNEDDAAVPSGFISYISKHEAPVKQSFPELHSQHIQPSSITSDTITPRRVRHVTEPTVTMTTRNVTQRSMSEDCSSSDAGNHWESLLEPDTCWPRDDSRLQLQFNTDETGSNDTPDDDIPGVHSPRQKSAGLEVHLDEHEDTFGFPLSIFTKGVVCHPYLALHHCDMLYDANVHGFVIGASNIMFKQKRHLVDVIVEMKPLKLDIQNIELRKQLTLTTADLRFADFLVQHVTDDTGNIYTDDTSWVGGNEWIQAQFKLYLISLLASVNDENLMEDFNASFVSAWKLTGNYQVWSADVHPGMETIIPGHPFAGHLSMADMKLRLSQAMQTTERGKKINAAVNQTGRAVMDTGRAVGGAITSAKSFLSSWIQNLGKDWNSNDDTQT